MTEANPIDGVASDLVVKRLVECEYERWDAFVSRLPEASFFHRAGWQQVIEQAFGHRTYFLYAQSGSEIHGILPLAHIKSFLFGNSLISLPFCCYGGIVADDAIAYSALEKAGCELAEQLGVDYLELRDRQPSESGWPTKELYVTFRKEISSDPEVNLTTIPRKQRAMIRKGMKAGLVSEVDATTDRFYEAYSQSVRNLGTPVFSRDYFKLLKNVFGEDCEVMTVTKGAHTIASVMSFYFRDEVLPYYGGGGEAARGVKGNDFMYWELMSRACARNVRIFDYGRSKVDTGSYRFKKHWGFTPEPLYYRFYLIKATKMPDLSPANPKFQFFIRMWRRLPLAVTRLVGPMLVRNLG